MTLDRRAFLKASSATLACASLGGMTSLLTSIKAHARQSSDYKALVCLFLYGGMDNHDTVIPYDADSYQQWATIRSDIISQQLAPRTRDTLLPLTPLNSAQFGNRQFALPAEFKHLHRLFEEGNAAIIGNVGPLIETANATSFNEESVKLPPRLFSHNDQQATWMSGTTEGAQYGWAGLYSDAITQSNNTFANITTSGGELLLTGRNTSPYIISGGKALGLDVIDEADDELKATLAKHFNADYFHGNGLLAQDMKTKISQSFTANNQYNEATADAPNIATQFPSTRLGKQLETVAKTIAARDSLGNNRQVFTIALGSFDTHSEQARTLPRLQQQIDTSIAAFYQAITEMGLQNNITLFSAADFGRTLATNGDGTDHGWGAHHFVVGGAVAGRQIYGDIPESTLGHALDAGSGRLIPTQSVDQYAAALGQWFGVEQDELNAIFPNLNQLGQPPKLFG
ncbi:DUF1501 domain-containing protein [Psychrobium sp. MM17-31]|uniref:DUF1501 domain-containing protein n=1 Tax=Psychrobium sp. MM17-31 TaxID=2917758 RepID=UPI001EF6EF48|nr:DUF1501 domain-containing protein [Psychrobium sp. MM17-31]MCG7531184.1 DUF1501 domain-containing protein [Psychrobium sp. MM17-31]